MSTRKIVKNLKKETFRSLREELIQGKKFPWDALGDFHATWFEKTNHVSIGYQVGNLWYEALQLPVIMVIEELSKRRVRDLFSDSKKGNINSYFYR